MELSKEYLAMKEAGTKVVGPTPGFPHGATIFTQETAKLGAPGKKVKHAFIEATMPELKGGAARQSAHGEASTTKAAIARAFRNLLKTIPKKRISVISAKISITTKIVEDSNVKVQTR